MRFFPWQPDRLQDGLQGQVALNLSPQATDSLCKALRADNIESAKVLYHLQPQCSARDTGSVVLFVLASLKAI